MKNLHIYKVEIETTKELMANIICIMDNLGVEGEIKTLDHEYGYKITGFYKCNSKYNPNEVLNNLGNIFNARKISISY